MLSLTGMLIDDLLIHSIDTFLYLEVCQEWIVRILKVPKQSHVSNCYA